MAKMCFQPVEWHLDMRISHSGPVLRRKVWQLTGCLNPSFVIMFQKIGRRDFELEMNSSVIFSIDWF